MARAIQKTAAKDYPASGISKGDRYWFAEVKTGPRSSITIRSKEPIPRSRLTSSEFLSTAYDLSDRLDKCDAREDLEGIKEEFEQLRDDTQEKLDNMPEGLQQGSTGELLQERADQCEDVIGEIEQALSDLDDDDGEDAEGDTVEEATRDQVRTAIEGNVSSAF